MQACRYQERYLARARAADKFARSFETDKQILDDTLAVDAYPAS